MGEETFLKDRSALPTAKSLLCNIEFKTYNLLIHYYFLLFTSNSPIFKELSTEGSFLLLFCALALNGYSRIIFEHIEEWTYARLPPRGGSAKRWRSTRNPKSFMLLQYECKFLTCRNSFRQPLHELLARSGCHLPQEGGFRAHPLHSRLDGCFVSSHNNILTH